MRKYTAAWRNYMKDDERDDLSKAERERSDAADKYRTLVKRLKDRCIKRMIRSAENK